MQIWHYTTLNPDGVGGVETHISAVSRCLRELGYEVSIGTNPPKRADFSAPLIVHTHGDSWPKWPLLRFLRNSPQVKWVQVCHGTTIGRMIACREFASISGWKGALRDFLPVQLAHAAIAVSEQASFEARRYFRSSIPIAVIPNGADTSIFRPLSQITKNRRIAFVGRAEDRVKNTDALLKACSEIQKSYPDFELFAAPGIPRSDSYGFARNLGPKFGKELYQTLSQCRALVLCSFYEGDPIVLREAQAMGLPVLASDLPQIRQNLWDYANVTYLDPRSSDSIVQAIRSVIEPERELKPIPRIRSWQQVAKELAAFYKTLR